MPVETISLWLVVVFCGLSAPLAFFSRKHDGLARRCAASLWLLASIFALILLGALIEHFVSLRTEYRAVASHTSNSLPLLYRISALWAGQEGSFLLWLALLLPMGFVLLQKFPRPFSVFALIGSAIACMSAISAPFARESVSVAEGAGLNEALQNPWMAVHPPLVFLGYGALAVLASFTVTGDVPQAILRKTARIGLVLLGLGIFTGSVWAYQALGWGGFWAWDPIENAALVPWLLVCAYLHDPKPINRIKRMAPFALACLGTFLARSGVLADSSAHAYVDANEAVIAILLALLCGAVVCCVVIALNNRERRKKQEVARKTEPPCYCARPYDFSQENPLLGRRVFSRVTYGYAGLILLGTLLPLVTGAKTPTFLYDVLTIAYALACCVLLLLWHSQLAIRRGLVIMLIATVAVFAVMFGFNAIDTAVLILLWLFMLPLALFAVGAFRLDAYSFSHVALLLLFAGALCATTLGSSGMGVYSAATATYTAEGFRVPLGSLSTPVSILFTPFTDVFAHTSQAVNAGKEVLIPYDTKPLILLFWVGGFGMLAVPLIQWIVSFRRKRKIKPTNFTDLT